ncbi:MAG: hypothetical protein GVY30_11700 [Chloroflexi bacterium]|nr:hypothetical protein [Chloroflexota bacterium]
MECHTPKNLSLEEHEKRTLSRRELLKALLASGGVAATSMLLPCEWTSPDVEVGVLPAHAQVSPTSTPSPTATPVRGAIIGCYVMNASGGGNISPTSTLRTYADVSHPVDPGGITLRRTIILNESGSSQELDMTTGNTDASGRFSPPDFDLSTVSPPISQGNDRVSVLWEFVDPADGTNDCQNNIDVV